MRISDDKKLVIDYITNGDTNKIERIFEGTYGALRKNIGEDFDDFYDKKSFIFQNQDGTKEKVGVEKTTLSHSLSGDSIEDKITVKPLNI